MFKSPTCGAVPPRALVLLLAYVALACTHAAALIDAVQTKPQCFMLRFQDINLDALAEAVHEIAGISSSRAGKWLTADEVAGLSGRSKDEVEKLQAFVTSLDGTLQVSATRDLAKACFPRLAALAAVHDKSSREASRLMAATRQAVQGLGDSAGSAAEQLAAALPPSVAGFVEVVIPVGAESVPSATPPTITPGPTNQATSIARAEAKADSFTTTGSLTSVQVLSPYGVPLPAPLGHWSGIVTNNDKVVAVPQFTFMDLLYAYGISDTATILNNINALPVAFMLPCSIALGQGDSPESVSYATATSKCQGSINVTWVEVYPSLNYSTSGPQKSLQLAVQDLPAMTCGEAVLLSGGVLPADTCSKMQAELDASTGVPSDISDNTLLYTFSALTTGLPTFVGLIGEVSLTLDAHVPEAFRNIGHLSYVSEFLDGVTLEGTNTPHELRRWLYNVPEQGLDTANGLRVAPAMSPGGHYDYSPADLLLANSALHVPVPEVTDCINPPLYIANNASNVYGGKGGEPALDIQMVTQYGAGSGAQYGFVANNGSADATETGQSKLVPGLEAYLGLKPMPDVLSFSYGINQEPSWMTTLMATDAILMKMAVMGISVLVSSGDNGQYPGQTGVTCSEGVISPLYYAASQWVTAVGAVQQARVSPGATPTVVSAMTSLGDITSGGGFGYTALGTIPRWQRRAVQRYIASQMHLASWPLSPAAVAVNGANYSVQCTGDSCVYGRGYPDVALMGYGIPTEIAGTPSSEAGTSASAPAFAGLVMHLNAAVRATPGLEHCRLGYLNPFLYWAAEQRPDAFTDITVGGTGFDTNGDVCKYSFNAAPGWDASTGLGVPNIKVLMELAVEYVKLQKRQHEHQYDGHYPDSHYPDDHYPDGHYPDDHYPDGHYPDDHYPDGHYKGQDRNTNSKHQGHGGHKRRRQQGPPNRKHGYSSKMGYEN